MTMRSGTLRHKVTIQTMTDGKDAVGSPTETASTLAKVWAAITPLNAGEVFRADHFEGDVTHRIRLRYRAGITPKMRVIYGSRTFDIRSVLNVDERNRELELAVTEIV